MHGIFNMMKLSVPAKFRGVVLFAFDTPAIKYTQIAEQATRIINHVLNLPVTLITESGYTSTLFDQIIYIDNTMPNIKPGQGTPWRNGDRYKVYQYSPYDETLLLDSDYLMLDQSLLNLFEQDFDYKIMTNNHSQLDVWPDRMGPYSFQYQWATAVLFRKTDVSKMLFDLVGRIQRNYLYYWGLYHVKSGSFRNDYAFTIANNILNGYSQNSICNIPCPMLTYTEIIESMLVKNNLLTIKEASKAYVIPRQNIHIMDKEYLLSDDFNLFVDTICNA